MGRFAFSDVMRRLLATHQPSGADGQKEETDLSACINDEFFRMLLQAPYQHIDVGREGGVGYEEFAAYFRWVATDEELRFAFDHLREGTEERITYGILQSFQQKYDAELFAAIHGGRGGCPDYLEYCTLLLGIRTSCLRPEFLALEGVAIPPDPAWLLQRLEQEWTCKETLQVHWQYVTQAVPQNSE
eukprot:EG_transcript_32203